MKSGLVRMAKKVLFLLTLLLLVSNLSNAQSSNTIIDKKFDNAVEYYNSNDLVNAKKLFDWIINANEINSKTTASYIFLAKISIKEHSYSHAEDLLKYYLRVFPKSAYIDEARLLLADAYYKQNKINDCLSMLMELASRAKSIEYASSAKNYIERLFEAFYTGTEIEFVISQDANEVLKPFLYLALGKFHLRNANSSAASEAFTYVIKNYPSTEEYRKALELLRNEESENVLPSTLEWSEDAVVLALLPLTQGRSGKRNVIAEQILDGIKFAFDEYNRLHEQQIGLLVKDTRNDAKRIGEIYSEIRLSGTPNAIIGPLFSDESKLACDLFANFQVPILSPTATDDDLTRVCDFFYQANPTFEMRGKVMARYVFYEQRKRRVAVINSYEGYSKIYADAFSEEFEQLGGEILLSKSYSVESTELIDVVNDIKTYPDSIEGIYMPISDKRVGPVLLAAFDFHQMLIPVFGNQDWMLVKGLDNTNQLSDSLIVTTDHFLDYQDHSLMMFSDKFARRTGRNLQRNVLYGYDTAHYLLEIIESVGPNPRSIVKKIESGVRKVGYHNDVAFSPTGINTILNIISYNNGVFELLEKYNYNN